MTLTRQNLIDFLEWMAHTTSPISHPDYYELEITDDNFLAMTMAYYEQYREKFYQRYGEKLIEEIINIIKNPLTISEYDSLGVLREHFDDEFAMLVEMLASKGYHVQLLCTIYTQLEMTSQYEFLLKVLCYINDEQTLSMISRLSLVEMTEGALILMINILYEMDEKSAIINNNQKLNFTQELYKLSILKRYTQLNNEICRLYPHLSHC